MKSSTPSGANGSTISVSGERRSRSAPRPTTPFRPTRRSAAGVEATKQTLDCCRGAGAESICGPFHSAIGLFSGSWADAGRVEVGRREHASASPSMREKTAGVMLAVEYLNRFETYFLTCAADTARFIKRCESPELPA